MVRSTRGRKHHVLACDLHAALLDEVSPLTKRVRAPDPLPQRVVTSR
ncbi:MAG TPA: hypothetical protein VGL60_13855 [Acidimicrobiales bacterium]